MPDPHPTPPIRTAVLAQVLGAVIAIGPIIWAYPKALHMPLLLAAGQGACAAFVSHKLEAPAWWLPIHLGFMPCIVLAHGIGLPPWVYLAAFVTLLLVFWRIQESRVPLFLSNRATAHAVAALLPESACKVMDLGCGNGVFLRRMAVLRPDSTFIGIEHAPLPWLWAKLVCSGLGNCRIGYGSLWTTPLAGYDLVYAFLSPAPMNRLWDKARQEMSPGARLISNSFEVPDISPESTIDVPGRRSYRLYCYQPNPAANQ